MKSSGHQDNVDAQPALVESNAGPLAADNNKPTLPQEQKSFKKNVDFTTKELIGYAFEFLLVFLAVFAGLLADNWRERHSEEDRERSYMFMLVKDLENDIYRLDSNTEFRMIREGRMDSLMKLLSMPLNNINRTELYRLALVIDGYETFFRNDRTILQFKNAGGMRMIRNDSVSAAIMDYDTYIISEVDWNNDIEARRTEYYKELRFKVFDAQAMHNIKEGRPLNRKLELLSVEPSNINPIAGSIFQMIRISATNRDCAATARAKAVNLISLIKRQYNL